MAVDSSDSFCGSLDKVLEFICTLTNGDMEKARKKWNIKDSGAPANFEQLFREIIGRRTGPLLPPLY